MVLFITVFFWSSFYVILGIAHGQVSKQLEYMVAVDKPAAVYWKSKWHSTFFFLRLFLHFAFPFALFPYIPPLNLLLLFILSVFIGVLLFDSMVNIGRQRGINWKFLGTCEGSWDMDCFWLKLDKYIPHLLFKFLLVLFVFLFYLFAL